MLGVRAALPQSGIPPGGLIFGFGTPSIPPLWGSLYVYIHTPYSLTIGWGSLWGGGLKKSVFSNLAGVSIFDGRGLSKRGSGQTRFHFLGGGPVFNKNPLGWKILLSGGHQNQNFFMWAGVSIFDGRGSFLAGVKNFRFSFF